MNKQTSRTKTASKAKTVKTLKSRKTTVVAKKKATKRKGLVHHAKRVYRLTPKFVHGALMGAFVGMVLVTWMGSTGNAHADNQTANPCIQANGGINVNKQNANVDVRTSNCSNPHTFVMKTWYADSDSGLPHDTQRLFAQSDPVKVKPSDSGWTHMNVNMPADTDCYYQVDLVDVTNLNDSSNPIVVSKTGGHHSCNPIPNYQCVSVHAVAAGRLVTIDQFNIVATHVTFTRAVINWGDSTNEDITPNVRGTQHTYADVKSYNITVTPLFNVTDKNDLDVKEKAAVPACSFPISTEPGTQQVCELKTGKFVTLPEGSYDTTLYGPPTDTQCVPAVTVTNTGSGGPALTNTGPGAILIILVFASIGGYAYHHAHRHIKSKKHHHRAAHSTK